MKIFSLFIVLSISVSLQAKSLSECVQWYAESAIAETLVKTLNAAITEESQSPSVKFTLAKPPQETRTSSGRTLSPAEHKLIIDEIGMAIIDRSNGFYGQINKQSDAAFERLEIQYLNQSYLYLKALGIKAIYVHRHVANDSGKIRARGTPSIVVLPRNVTDIEAHVKSQSAHIIGLSVHEEGISAVVDYLNREIPRDHVIDYREMLFDQNETPTIH